MDSFENMDKIKENMINSLDKITDEKKLIYDQIKRLETENYIINNNLEYFQTYLNYLEYKKASEKSVSNIDNNIQINSNNLKFEQFINMNNYKKNIKIEIDNNRSISMDENNNEFDMNIHNNDINKEKDYFDNYDI